MSFSGGSKKEVTAHNMFLSGLRGVLPCTLSFVAIVFSLIARVHAGCVPALRIVHMYTSASRVTQVLLPRDTTFGHWRKQLANATKKLNQPTNLAAQKPGRSQTSCVVVVCLTVSQSVPLSVSGSQSPRQSVFWVTIMTLLRSPCAPSPCQAQATRPHPDRQRHADPLSTVAHLKVAHEAGDMPCAWPSGAW